MLLALLLAFGALTSSTDSAQSSAIAIYIGPQMRDGFVDVDQGILDSIDDLVSELKRDKRLLIVARPEQATIRLEIVGRAVAGSAGSFAMPVGAGAIAVPIPGHTLNAILKVRDYEKPMFVNDQEYGTWPLIGRAACAGRSRVGRREYWQAEIGSCETYRWR